MFTESNSTWHQTGLPKACFGLDLLQIACRAENKALQPTRVGHDGSLKPKDESVENSRLHREEGGILPPMQRGEEDKDVANFGLRNHDNGELVPISGVQNQADNSLLPRRQGNDEEDGDLPPQRGAKEGCCPPMERGAIQETETTMARSGLQLEYSLMVNSFLILTITLMLMQCKI